jgi:gamma-glutamyltranspeptidase/glutathione hydrolase
LLSRTEVTGTQGAVAATHWLATQAGMSMFDRGGNAFDAAVAAAFVLQVVEPHQNGPAGDVPILVHQANSDGVRVICGQGPMPKAATIDRFRDLGLAAIPGSGLLAACVPGAFGAWLRLLRDFGTLRLADVLEAAIGYAEHGFPLLPEAALMIEAVAPLFREEWAESGRTYLRNGVPPAPGERVRNPVLAATFRRILAEALTAGADREAQIEGALAAFYDGFVADAIDTFVTTSGMIDATGKRHRGLLTGDDMAGWRAGLEPTCSLGYRDLQVHKCRPWSQGPVFLQQLALLERHDLGAMGLGSADAVHTMIESAKLAFADREAWYGDPEFVDVPLTELLSPGYTDQRLALLGPDAAAVLRPGSPSGRTPWIPVPSTPRQSGLVDPDTEPGWLAQLAYGAGAVVRLTEANGDTCCVTATDSAGNMVAATPSGGWLKSSPVVPGLGFPLGTRGQMAWLAEGHNNAVAPGKRPRTTLSPTMAFRDGEPYLAFGTPGGDQQDQWTLNFFVNHVDFGLSPQAAIDALAFHSGHMPSSFTPHDSQPRTIVMERGSDPQTLAELRRRGHEISLVEPNSLGKVCATGLGVDGMVLGAASRRGAQASAAAR